MIARSSIQQLFGRSGYVTYARAIGRCPTTFNRSVSNPSTVTSKLVIVVCELLSLAKEAGHCPIRLLDLSNIAPFPSVGTKTGLQQALEDQIGPDAVDQLARHLDLKADSVLRSVARVGARNEPHFRIMAIAMIAMKRSGRPVTLDMLAQPSTILEAA